MNQKHVVVLSLLIILIGLSAAGVNNFKKELSFTPSPEPTMEALRFDGQVKGEEVEEQKMIKQYKQFPGELSLLERSNKKAVIETEKGKIEFEIYPDAVKAASNFIFLAKDNFYNGLIFHRVEPDFVIQGGDPLGNGTGGPGYTFEDDPVTKPYDKGIVAMANRGPDTNGSQFFIMLEDKPLPPSYSIFGKVISGQEVVDEIKVGDVMKRVSIEPLK